MFACFIGISEFGGIIEKYKYDAWGNHEAEVAAEGYVALAEINPFRYRGYYYDTETGLYYLQTRYYDPEVGRFISRDSIEYANPETINGLNLYAYCGNNPVMKVDLTGNAWREGLLFGFGAVVGAVIGGFLGANGWYNAKALEFTNQPSGYVYAKEVAYIMKHAIWSFL